jgi:hypothetical protein
MLEIFLEKLLTLFLFNFLWYRQDLEVLEPKICHHILSTIHLYVSIEMPLPIIVYTRYHLQAILNIIGKGETIPYD